MLFESLVGYTPFSGSSTNETYDNLRRWKQTLRRPRQSDGRAAFSDRTWDLITRLIADPINRLRSFEHVKRMQYFADINFSTLRSMIPPFTPQLDSETDAGYFDDFTSEADMAKYADAVSYTHLDVYKRQGLIRPLFKETHKFKVNLDCNIKPVDEDNVVLNKEAIFHEIAAFGNDMVTKFEID